MTQHNNDIYELAEALYKAGYRAGHANSQPGLDVDAPGRSFVLWLMEGDDTLVLHDSEGVYVVPSGDEQEVKARKTLREMT